MDGHKIDAARLAEQGDRAYAVAEVENDQGGAEELVSLWWLYRRLAATVMGTTLVRIGDALRFAR